MPDVDFTSWVGNNINCEHISLKVRLAGSTIELAPRVSNYTPANGKINGDKAPSSSGLGHLPFTEKIEGSNASGVTILEIAKAEGAALAAPASADSAAKGKSKVADRRRKEKE